MIHPSLPFYTSGRGEYKGGMHVGKVSPYWKGLLIAYGGKLRREREKVKGIASWMGL